MIPPRPIKKFTATYENIQILSEKNRKEVLTAEVWPFRLPSILFAACSAGTCSTKTALQQSVFLSLSRGPLRCPFIGIPGYDTMGSSWWFHGDITDHWDRIRGDSKENIVGDER